MWSSATLKQISHGRKRGVTPEFRYELIQSLLRFCQTHARTILLRARGGHWHDGGGGLAMTQDENLLAPMLGLVDDV
jgi:hypothetical protein